MAEIDIKSYLSYITAIVRPKVQLTISKLLTRVSERGVLPILMDKERYSGDRSE